MKLTEDIYLVDESFFNVIKNEFELVDDKSWYLLYQNKIDKTFWRLDKYEKLVEQFFIRLNSNVDWTEFDDSKIRINFLLKTRGTTDKKCIWKDCNKNALIGLVYCENHAYEMGIEH